MKPGPQTVLGFLRRCRRDWTGQLTLALGAYTVLFLLWQHFRWGGEAHRTLISDLAFLPVSLAAAVVTLRAARRPGLPTQAGRGWRLIGLSFLLYWMGDLCWFYFEAIRHVDPFPSVADAFYLAQYPMLLWGIMTLPAEPGGRSDWTRMLLDAAAVVICGWVVTWYLVLGPTAVSGEGTLLEQMLAVGYPVGDLAVFFGLVVIIYRRRNDGALGPRGMLAVSLFLLFLGDLAYGRLVQNGQYQSGGWPDSLWMVGQYFMVVSGQLRFVQPLGAELEPRPRSSRRNLLLLTLPYAAVALTYGLLLYAVRLDDTAEGLLLGAVAVTAAVMARQIVVLGENTRLLKNRADLVEEIRRSEVRFRSLVQNSTDVIAVVEAGAVIRYVSPSLKSVLGYSPEHLVGLPLTGLIHPEDGPDTMAAINNRGSRAIQCRLRHCDGAWLYAEATVNNLLHDPDVGGIVLNLRDVTERRVLEERLTHQAFHDSLTNLANRARLYDRVRHALAEQRRRGEPISLLFLDLDGFKTVNDSLGHAAGDELLCRVAERLTACVRAGDTVARLGGDEFAVLMEGAGHQDAETVAGRISQVLDQPFAVAGKEVGVLASIGIAVSEDGAESADDLLRNADVAMYAAKSDGKGCYALFHPRMHEAALGRLELEADFRSALDQGEFLLHYQPVVQVDTGRIASVEALCRWQHPRRGLVRPGEFIPFAEESGLIIPLGRWVLREACRQVAQWRREFAAAASLAVSVNLSARQLLLGQELVADVAAALHEAGLPAGSLTLEITESVLIEGGGPAAETLTGLQGLGVKLAIDDFGTGYSSLSYLRGFPVDTVKIDRSFIDVVGRGRKETALVRGIIDLSHALGLVTVAEGIERSEQVAELAALGCALGQGYYFSPPASAAETAPRLALPCLPVKETDAEGRPL